MGNLVISVMMFVIGTVFLNYQPASAEVVFARIVDVKMRDEAIYDPGCVVSVSVKVVALGSRGDPYFIVLFTKHEDSDAWISQHPEKFSVRKSTDVSGGIVEYWIPKNATLGIYDLQVSVFDGYQKLDGTVILKKILVTKEITDAFEVVQDSKSGCIKRDIPAYSPYSEKEMPFTLYEVKPDGLYINGIKVTQEEPEQFPEIISSEIPSSDLEENEVIEDISADKSQDVRDEFTLYYVIFIPVIAIVSILVLKKFHQKSKLAIR